MKATTVTLEILKQYLGLIGYTLVRLSEADEKRMGMGMNPRFYIVDNLGNKTDYVVNEELLEMDLGSSVINFFFNECWIETIDDDAVSLSNAEDNAGIFINFHKQKPETK